MLTAGHHSQTRQWACTRDNAIHALPHHSTPQSPKAVLGGQRAPRWQERLRDDPRRRGPSGPPLRTPGMAIHTARVNQGPRSAEDKPVPSTAVSSTHPGLSLRQSLHSASREDRHPCAPRSDKSAHRWERNSLRNLSASPYVCVLESNVLSELTTLLLSLSLSNKYYCAGKEFSSQMREPRTSKVKCRGNAFFHESF